MFMSERQKMISGLPYDPGDPELQADQTAAKQWMARYNAAMGASPAERRDLLRQKMGEVGEGAIIRPPFHCDYGYNIRLGRGVFMNFNGVILDICEVVIGDQTQIGPGVQILTADHPRDAAERAEGMEFGKPVTIGRKVRIGGGASFCRASPSATMR